MNVKTLALCTLALTGCAAETSEPNTPTSVSAAGTPGEKVGEKPVAPTVASGAEAVQHIDENLARLQALGVFTVGTLVIDYPQGSVNCYGPCPGQEPVIQAAKEQAASKLASFTDRAVLAAKEPKAGPCDARIEANLAALATLRIVVVQGFSKTTPKSQANCYNLPCAEDLAAAKEEDAVKACKLEAIVRATKP